ncbi:MAG: 50S ribosomal protein L30 [Proteobacteria bacterium]|nr:50S ribosomal protein L30 [Pseudomonadota bacterium]MBU1740328.1 50S ribosomal protein L30 [Pseudomonadota bacterium]
MSRISYRLVRSGIGRPEKHRRTLRALKLTKMNRTVTVEDTPSIRGMLRQVSHLVRVVSEEG